MVTKSSSMMPQFKHAPLKLASQQIRLLKVDHASKEAFRATLHHVDVDNLPPYQALSYTWGPADLLQDIDIDGSTFQIRPNLFDFLCVYLRKEELQRDYMWIDQIYIDQSSVAERNEQVPLMAKIYSGAERVLAWFGKHPGGEVVEPFLDHLGIYGADTVAESKAASAMQIPFYADLLSLKGIFAVPYWSRHWIIQELILAKSRLGVYGDYIINFGKLAILWRTYGQHPREHHVLFYKHTEGRSTDSARTFWPFSIHGLLGIPSQCADIRDKAYGLQSILPTEARIQIDYSKTVEEVFVDQAVAFSRQMNDDHWGRHQSIAALAYSMQLLTKQQKDRLPTRGPWERSDRALSLAHSAQWIDRETAEVNKASIRNEVMSWLSDVRSGHATPLPQETETIERDSVSLEEYSALDSPTGLHTISQDSLPRSLDARLPWPPHRLFMETMRRASAL